MSRARILSFVALMLALVTVPIALVAWHGQTLAAGRRVVLHVERAEPATAFRGRELRLSYAISHLPTRGLAAGATIYVPLRRAGVAWTGTSVVRRAPSDGTFIRGRVADRRLRYGIESVSVDDDERGDLAEAIEDGKLYADVEIDEGGRAELVALEIS